MSRIKKSQKVILKSYSDSFCYIELTINGKNIKFLVQPYYYEYVKNLFKESEDLEKTYNEIASIGYLTMID